MTHREIIVHPGGVREYADGHLYFPVPDEERKYARRKPDDPRAVRFHGKWFTPLQLQPDRLRRMPETRPDEETLEHRARCRCTVCRRPAAAELWRKRNRRKNFSRE